MHINPSVTSASLGGLLHTFVFLHKTAGLNKTGGPKAWKELSDWRKRFLEWFSLETYVAPLLLMLSTPLFAIHSQVDDYCSHATSSPILLRNNFVNEVAYKLS